MSSSKVLFMGDDHLKGAAAYLGAMMTFNKIDFIHVKSSEKAELEHSKADAALYIISDYPSVNLPEADQRHIASRVEAGASLLMIGGWESFHGLGGEYNKGPVADILPVECMQSDDRDNYCQGLFPVALNKTHPAVVGLDWDNPPVFCGYNKVKAVRPGAEIILGAQRMVIKNGCISMESETIPLLIASTHGKGKTCALTTDLAPHWVGGWVDWGKNRVQAAAPGGNEVEVGDEYARFVGKLIGWLVG